MPGVRDIKRRIRSVKNIEQITKAMKMVAAAKLRRTQAAVIASLPYAGKLDEVLGRIVASAKDKTHPLMQERPVKSVGIVLITSDRGLSGGYNSNVIKKAILESVRMAPAETSFIAVGRKGRDYLKRRGKTINYEYTGVKDIPTFIEAQHIARQAVSMFMDGSFDEVYLVYQEFISPVQQRPVIKKMLPLSYETEQQEAQQAEYLYEPAPEQVLEILLPKYINNLVFQALMEAKASEFGAQMAAMTSATDNAAEMIDKLTLSFNRARQAAITKEISEIVGGANALQA